ncbi:GNAT family N-acetyltransferase [Tomitella gaofuii]|uniref:GNAT family N-acetyltransferase n=1 Tax=Tomitella gaofuii TaxID=2760083 RepID=UPI0015FA23DF|nr:GNAT family N-acetyltransferase [Tomitella gaofuii]
MTTTGPLPTRCRAPIHPRMPGRLDLPDAVVRAAVERDLPMIQRMYSRCSAESLHHRWTGTSNPVPNQSPACTRGALSLVCELAGPSSEIVALGEAVHIDAHGVELAVLVEDRYHRRGIGSMVIDELITRSALSGAERVDVHSDRPWILGWLRPYGPVTIEFGRGEHAASVELLPPHTPHRTAPIAGRIAQEATAQ